MNYIQFKQQFKEFVVFSLNDIKKLDHAFDRRRLSEWQDKGYIKKIRRGYYIFLDVKINESMLFFVANEIYSPSYVSFESALSYSQLIPESVFAVTSATSKKTATFETPVGTFIYRTIKPSLMFGYELVLRGDYKIKIAKPEKALIDFLYLRPDLVSENDFQGLRINQDSMKARCDKKIFSQYLKEFKNKALNERVNNFLKVYSL